VPREATPVYPWLVPMPGKTIFEGAVYAGADDVAWRDDYKNPC